MRAGMAARWRRCVLALAERRGHRLADLSLDLGLDPIGAMAAQGRMSASWDAVAQRMGDTLQPPD